MREPASIPQAEAQRPSIARRTLAAPADRARAHGPEALTTVLPSRCVHDDGAPVPIVPARSSRGGRAA